MLTTPDLQLTKEITEILALLKVTTKVTQSEKYIITSNIISLIHYLTKKIELLDYNRYRKMFKRILFKKFNEKIWNFLLPYMHNRASNDCKHF